MVMTRRTETKIRGRLKREREKEDRGVAKPMNSRTRESAMNEDGAVAKPMDEETRERDKWIRSSGR